MGPQGDTVGSVEPHDAAQGQHQTEKGPSVPFPLDGAAHVFFRLGRDQKHRRMAVVGDFRRDDVLPLLSVYVSVTMRDHCSSTLHW